MDLPLSPLSKLEFMQWKDMDRLTFTRICNSASHWLDYGNSFLGYRRTAYDRLSAFWKDNYWSVLRRTNILVTQCHQAETLTRVVT